jgi:hypothetical protein
MLTLAPAPNVTPPITDMGRDLHDFRRSGRTCSTRPHPINDFEAVRRISSDASPTWKRVGDDTVCISVQLLGAAPGARGHVRAPQGMTGCHSGCSCRSKRNAR